MRIVTQLAKVNADKCVGCGVCEKICPTLSIVVTEKKAVVDEAICFGCGNCEQRCPVNAIEMIKRDESIKLYVDPSEVDQEKIEEICSKARFNPKQIICYCTETRAEEVAAAIIKGADTPEQISRETGIRSGCKVECIQPILRLLDAAGVNPKRPQGWQWYGKTPTIWDIPEDVKKKYSEKGFYFDEDIKILNKVADMKKNEKGER